VKKRNHPFSFKGQRTSINSLLLLVVSDNIGRQWTADAKEMTPFFCMTMAGRGRETHRNRQTLTEAETARHTETHL